MPGAVRLGDICTGHGCYPPRPNSQASNDVNVNGRGFHRAGDGWIVHCCYTSCHSSVSSQGSKTVFVNGRSAIRIGDGQTCASKALQGSNNVYAGG